MLPFLAASLGFGVTVNDDVTLADPHDPDWYAEHAPHKQTWYGVLLPPNTYCRYTVDIGLDVEDDDNATKVVGGKKADALNYGIEIGTVTHFKYCAINLEDVPLPRVNFDYVVLRLDMNCPDGSLAFARYHDTEDHNNKNSFGGNLVNSFPNEIGKNARLEYCLVEKTKTPNQRYPFTGGYAVFANPSNLTSYMSHAEIKIDDEDSNNANKWYWYGRKNDKDFQKRVKNIVNGDGNTYYNVLKWTGSVHSILNKTADMVAVDAPVAAVPLNPSISGFDHSSVTIDLKASGKVSVSIANVKGAVVARMAEENLQAGTHVMNWNSGAVPNGRYIVTVRQNGLVSAKSVILK